MDENHKLIGQFVARFDKLKSERATIENTWQEIADNCVSNGADFTSTRSAGDNSRTRRIFDITVIQAIDYLVSALHSGLTNPSTKWFELRMKDSVLSQDPEIAAFLTKARDYMLDCFNSSSSAFPGQNHEVLLSLVQYGPGCLLVEDNVEKGIRFSAIHISEVYIAQNAFGIVDTVYRKFQMTARQMVQRWGDAVHRSVQDAYKKNPDTKFKVLHVVEPKSDKYQPKNKLHNFVSYHIDITNKSLISVGGYFESPYIIARFSKFSSEDYGRSPTWQTLPTVKLVNRMTETIIKSAQLQVSPPLLLADDGVMMPVQAKPNGVIYGGISMDGTARVQPLNVGGNLNIGAEMLGQFQKQIRDSFFVDQLVFRDGPMMTATEVIQRQQEALKLLGPVIGRLQTEYLTPLIAKIFSIYARSGKLGRIPQKVLENEYEIEYVGPVPMLQKQQESAQFNQFIGAASSLIQLNPSTLDNFDLDVAARKMADSLAIWKDVVRPVEDVAKIREAQAQAQQAQMAMQSAEQAATINSIMNK